ncbi:MAG: Serine aminopeptidase, S33 [uncultured Thiotrichaceae bacterium]|uniref:Serine aminopeptidase, S33 n=1 Tax=uncultured Thiotrichaceae bacterium TaxID=298394 RepID=A0A6S6TRW5_9GAMM|nr:MAG: Serine aminopeptidase, S33 [uncultured Thiotrichaceae bacterium]
MIQFTIKQLSQQLLIIPLLLTALLITGCGGSGDDSADNSDDATKERAILISANKLKSFQSNELLFTESELNDINQQEYIQYGVDLYKLVYTTLDADEKIVNSSGLVAIPKKNAQLASPLLSYQHGSIFYNAEAPTNDLSTTAPPILLASLGFVTVAADYVGYGESHGHPHPYLLQTPSAAVGIDLLIASKKWLAQQDVPLNQQLFLTGYSQGGYVTMAMHKALETLNDSTLTVTAAVPAAGPYHIEETLDALVDSIRLRENTERSIADTLASFIGGQIVPDDTDIKLDTRIFSYYIDDGANGVAAENVHDWKATAPVRLFHGRDDETVPFINAPIALAAMQAKNSNDVQVIECQKEESGHKECVPNYGLFMIDYFFGIAQGL